jgi:tetratricopeptide (TPR) repeat protein
LDKIMLKARHHFFVMGRASILCGITCLLFFFSDYSTPQKVLAQKIRPGNPTLMRDSWEYSDKTKEFMRQASEQIKKSEYKEAFESCSKAIELEPRSAMLHVARGFVSLSLKDNDAANKDLNEAVKLYESQGKPKEAASIKELVEKMKINSNPGDESPATEKKTDYNPAP